MLISLLQKWLQHCFSSVRMNSAFAYLPTVQSRPAESCHVSLEQAGAGEAGAQRAAHSWEHRSWNLSLCETLYCNKGQAVSKARNDCGHHPSSHSPRTEVTFLHECISNRRKVVLKQNAGLCLVISLSQEGSTPGRGYSLTCQRDTHTATCPHSVPNLAIPWGRNGWGTSPLSRTAFNRRTETQCHRQRNHISLGTSLDLPDPRKFNGCIRFAALWYLSV